MNYQNMGTFDGGVVGGVRTGGAAVGCHDPGVGAGKFPLKGAD